MSYRYKSFFAVAFLFFFLISCSEQSLTVQSTDLNCPDEVEIHTGEATYYDPSVAQGNRSYDSIPKDMMIGSMNAVDYAGSQICGACVRITGPKGTVTVKIIDQCPECPKGNIDLSPQAFSKIADIVQGRVPITWQIVACDIVKPIEYHFKKDSNQWWAALQVLNHRYPVYQLEYLTPEMKFKSIDRAEYNYFIEPGGIGNGPYTFRVTDIYGHVLLDSLIIFNTNGNIPGGAQFPPCTP